MTGSKADSTRFAFLIFLLGFLSISSEILAIRLFTPYFGAGALQTSLLIGTVLMFYAAGNSRSSENSRSFRIMALLTLLTGLCLSNPTLHYLKLFLQDKSLNYYFRLSLCSLLVVAPLSFIHGLLFPVLLSERPHAHIKSGIAWSTLGAFTGAVGTALALQFYVSASQMVVINTLICVLISILLLGPRHLFVQMPIIFLAVILNLGVNQKLVGWETGSANYDLVEAPGFKGLIVNGGKYSSMIFTDGRTMEYNDIIHKFYLRGTPPKDVLVLGAGGFTLSVEPSEHRFTYVDTDKKIREVIKQKFNPSPRGELVNADGREFILRNRKKFDLIFQDVYDGHPDVPLYLLTKEHFLAIQEDLKPRGYFAINLSHYGPLTQGEDGRKIAATLQTVFSVCYFIPYSGKSLGVNDDSLRQSVGICQNDSRPIAPHTDDRY